MGRRLADSVGLCHRCEHRAEFLETGMGSRYECGQTFAVGSCYMYAPVRGVVLVRDKGDRRPLGGPTMIASRAHAVALAPGSYVLRKVRNGYAVYFEKGTG